MTAPSMDFWFTMGSTYTYLTVSRIEDLARTAGVSVRMRIFKNVLALTGAAQLPFLPDTPKMTYMRRDIERRAQKLGLAASFPFPYPAPNPQRANRVATIGMREGWGPAYVRAAYRHWFEHGIGSGGDENLRIALTDCQQGHDIARILALADSNEVVDEINRATEEARDLGLFGSPSFIVNKEVFWGDDHLEDAIHWAKHGCL